MAKKIIIILMMLTPGVFSCSEEKEPLPAEQKTEIISRPMETVLSPLAPPTNRTVYVDARMRASISKTADIYYMSPFPTGAWTYLGTLSGTNCQQITSFSAPDGAVLYFAVFDGGTSINYWARAGTCALTTDSYYCGDYTSYYNVTISGANVAVGLQVNVAGGDFVTCM